MGLTTNGLPAMAAYGNRTVAVVLTTPGHDLVWTSWELGGNNSPWTFVPFQDTSTRHTTDVAPAVSFRSIEAGGTVGEKVWIGVRDPQDGLVYQTMEPFFVWGARPVGPRTKVSPAASGGNIGPEYLSDPIVLTLAEPPDDQLYINAYVHTHEGEIVPDPPWQAVIPSPLTSLSPAISVVDFGRYMFMLATAVGLGSGPNSHLVLGQGDPFTPADLSASWRDVGFETNIAPAIASAYNRTVAVAVDPAGAMFYSWWDLGGRGSGWIPLGADIRTDVRPAVAVVDRGNYMFVLARGTDGEMWLNQGIVGGAIVGWGPAE